MKHGIGLVATKDNLNKLQGAFSQTKKFKILEATDNHLSARQLFQQKDFSCLIIEISSPIYKVQDFIGDIHRNNLSLKYLTFCRVDEHTIIYAYSDCYPDECVASMEELFRKAFEPSSQCVKTEENDPFWNYWFQIPPDYATRRYIKSEILRGMTDYRFQQYQKSYYLNLKGRGYYLFVYEQMGQIHFDHKENSNCFNFIGEIMIQELRTILGKYNGGEIYSVSPLRTVVIANDFETSSSTDKALLLHAFTEEIFGVTRKNSGFCFISAQIASIEKISEIYQLFESNRINHFFCCEKQPMTMSELMPPSGAPDYDAIQRILRDFKDAITYDTGTQHAIDLIQVLFLNYVKPSFDINLFFYCISVIKNSLISLYGGVDIANRFSTFSINKFMFDSIEAQCNALCGIIVDLNSQYVNPVSKSHPSIYQAIHYIRDHYSEELTVAFLAKSAHMNSVYFGRLFKSKTGFSVNQFILRCRIHAAMKYLKSTSKSVSEISQLVGFRDLQYFSNSFHEQTGVSPSQYRVMQSSQIDYLLGEDYQQN